MRKKWDRGNASEPVAMHMTKRLELYFNTAVDDIFKAGQGRTDYGKAVASP
jgi:hypothetical protein